MEGMTVFKPPHGNDQGHSKPTDAEPPGGPFLGKTIWDKHQSTLHTTLPSRKGKSGRT